MTQAMWGADADALAQLSRQLGQGADTLTRSAGQITASLGSSPWRGRDAEQFRARWHSADRRLLLEAASALRDAAAEVARHSTDQRRASASDGSGGSGFGPMRGMPGGPKWPPGLGILTALPLEVGRLWSDSKWADLETIAGLSGPLSFMAANKAIKGDYTKNWHSVLDAGKKLGLPHNTLRFKKSPFLQFVQPKLHPFSKYFDSVSTGLGRVSPILKGLNLLGHGFEIHQTIKEDGGFGFRSAVATAETVADVAKMFPHPIPYAAGMTIQAFVEVAKVVKDNDIGLDDFNRSSLADIQKTLLNGKEPTLGNAVSLAFSFVSGPLLRIVL